MKKFLLRTGRYTLFILVALEILVRVFHLYTEDPPRFIDEKQVEKRVPGHTGYAVTGNRNQNFSKFRINRAGFNSFREFEPATKKRELALIGDSFIEGFHQDYDDSTGKKIEQLLEDTEVYEYGYAGYDLANQMHLIQAYRKDFEKIDEIIVYLNYESDLQRATYKPDYGRIALLSSTLFKIRDNIKLLAYGSKIGILEPIKKLLTGAKNKAPKALNDNREQNLVSVGVSDSVQKTYLDNFKNLVAQYGFDHCKTSILLDSRKTPYDFLVYLDEQNYSYIDYGGTFEAATRPVNLIYDHHWNDYGRELIAKVVAHHIAIKNSYHITCD
jgi:hypothetical protein